MSKSIELPDPLFAEIDGYANRVAASPVTVILQAWDEFRRRHPQAPDSAPLPKPGSDELLAMVRSLRGSISLPHDVPDEALITQARTENAGTVATMDSSHVMQAIASGHSGFEDEIQIACASAVTGLTAIITRNLPDYSHSPVPAMTAQAWLEQHPPQTTD